ncbi:MULTISPECIES: hypothetical protein [Sorangium]|uniref:Secreted protein n=1 Tax=Sorangium cellulosum TaxID=56 RepID=A0A4P2QXP9_SORCE|nr:MULTISPECIES: hypothetical protein [Sorangium]AUX35324.1 hypothetical protein SOCE836_075150 [Sorangium cellulosum]WCQ94628.1 hypothetical protein NQZ70_07396 [Sorangium sp. Soce836]
MKPRDTIVAAVFTLTLSPASALAQDQPWLKDRRYTEGIGIRAGDLELHPGIAAEFGYDSNFFRRDEEDVASVDDIGPVGSMRLRITPSFSLSTLSRQRQEVTPDAPPPDVEFRAGIAATYDDFFPVSGPERGQERLGQQRNIGGSLDANLTILPQRPWSAVLDASLGRTIAPSDIGISNQSFRRVHAGAGAELVWTPGGGLLDWRLGYRFAGTFFELDEYDSLTNMQHIVRTRGRWRFLPRTALIYDASLGFVDYPNPGAQLSSHPLRAQLGINGLVTSSFGLLAMAGWGASFYTPNNDNDVVHDFDSVIGQLELKWFLTPNPSADPAAATLALSSLSAGFTRDFHDSFLASYFERDRGYLKLTYFFGGRFLLILDGGVAAHVFPGIPADDGRLVAAEEPWTDVRIDASLFGEYRFADSLGINTTLRYGNNISSTALRILDESNVQNHLGWQQFEAYLGVRWFM